MCCNANKNKLVNNILKYIFNSNFAKISWFPYFLVAFSVHILHSPYPLIIDCLTCLVTLFKMGKTIILVSACCSPVLTIIPYNSIMYYMYTFQKHGVVYSTLYSGYQSGLQINTLNLIEPMF
jgi:hypothetical protein